MTLQELQYKNDRALIRFWKASEQIKIRKRLLDQSEANLALILAEREYSIAQDEMTQARMEYLEARSPDMEMNNEASVQEAPSETSKATEADRSTKARKTKT